MVASLTIDAGGQAAHWIVVQVDFTYRVEGDRLKMHLATRPGKASDTGSEIATRFTMTLRDGTLYDEHNEPTFTRVGEAPWFPLPIR